MMEFQLSKQPVGIHEVLYDAVSEQPIECDVLLPDHCPDIEKILRCDVRPALLSHLVNGDQLVVEGIACIQVFYLDTDGCLRRAEYKAPYSKRVPLRAAPQNPSVLLSQSVDYFNCRTVSARRLDMRGAVSINARVLGRTEEQVVCAAQGMGIQLRCKQAQSVSLLPCTMQPLAIREELELASGKPAPGAVLRCDASVHLSDQKALAGKLVVKGEVLVRLLYQSEEDPKRLELAEYALPVGQVIDIAGLDEGCPCNVWYEANSLEATPRRGDDGVNRAFMLELSFSACAYASKTITFEAAEDCYSTRYECKQTAKQVSLTCLADTVLERYALKEPFELPGEIKSVSDVWCVPAGISVLPDADGLTVNGRLRVSVLAQNGTEELCYLEQLRDFSQHIALGPDCENPTFTPHVTVEQVSFAMSGKLEVRCTLVIQGDVYDQRRRQMVCDIGIDEARPKKRQDQMLYLYYAAQDEPVWEIAKRYNTSVEAIQQVNQAEQTVPGGRTVLLIPMQ